MTNFTFATILINLLFSINFLVAQSADLYFHNPSTGGNTNEIGYHAVYNDAATNGNQNVKIKTTVVEVSNTNDINHFSFASDSGHDFRFNLRDNNVSTGDSVWVKVKFELLDAYSGYPVNMNTSLNFDNISESNKIIDKVSAEKEELTSYQLNTPTNLVKEDFFTFAGTAHAGNNGAPEQAVTFNYNNSNSFHVTFKIIKKKNQSSTVFFRVDGSSELVTFSNPVLNFNTFITALPLTLVDFNAELVNEEVLINWITEEEEDLSHFEIERSENGIDFETIEIIEARGIINETNYYNTTDWDLQSGATYYRLKSVDFDGTTYYSNLEVIELTTAKNYEINVYPNPVSDWVNIKSESIINTVSIYNTAGLNVLTTEANTNTARLQVNELQKGQYFITIQFEDGTIISQPVIIL